MSPKVSKWLESAAETPIEMSSRIRLARNIEGLSFPGRSQDVEKLDQLVEDMANHLEGYKQVDVRKLSYEARGMLVEKHLISPNFAKHGHACFINEDESISIMVHEEDHIRIQSLGSSVDMNEIYRSAEQVDKILEENFKYAFDENYGYLTACPTNVGTGLRASIMMHLPALASTGLLQQFVSNISRFGFTLRGIYGEGSQSIGYIYQLSNQLTLGQTEDEIIDNLLELKEQLIEEEISLRERFIGEHEVETRDRIFRSLGLLRYAQTISLKEAAKALSDVKIGVDLELLTLEKFKFQPLIQMIQPAFIKTLIDSDEVLSVAELDKKIDERRATLLRNTLGG